MVKVPSLDGLGKMSKSENQAATIYLADDDDSIRRKIMKCKTDAGPSEKNTAMPDYIENIFSLMELVCTTEKIAKYKNDFNEAAIRYGDLKKDLAEDMVAFVAPIRQKANDIMANETMMNSILTKGAEKANKSANATMASVRKALGFTY